MNVSTKFGTIIVRESADPNHPGVCIDLRNDAGEEIGLAVVEENEGSLVTHVWRDSEREDPTHRIVHSVDSSFTSNNEDSDSDLYEVGVYIEGLRYAYVHASNIEEATKKALPMCDDSISGWQYAEMKAINAVAPDGTYHSLPFTNCE